LGTPGNRATRQVGPTTTSMRVSPDLLELERVAGNPLCWRSKRDGEVSVWGEVWSDYELVPPFPQLGRPIHRLNPEEADVINLDRFNTVTLPATTLVFGLEKLGWIRGRPADAGGFSEHAKPFYSSGITAIVEYDPGAYVSSIVDSDDQTITGVFCVPRIYSATEHWPSHDDRIPWNQVDPVVVSEVLADLTTIVAKAN